MAQFPVSDAQGIIDGLNYVLSGPVGTGQSLVGFDSDQTAYLTGNARPPFTKSTPQVIMGTTVAVATATWLDARTWRYDFTAAQPTAPFQPGNAVQAAGVTPSAYDLNFVNVGVVECTTTYVICRSDEEYANPGAGAGGTISLYNSISMPAGQEGIHTDCTAKVLVNGLESAVTPVNYTASIQEQTVQDRVLLTAQLNNTFTYSTEFDATLLYTVRITRYAALPNTDPTKKEYNFESVGAVISEQDYQYTVEPTTGGIDTIAFAGAKVAYAVPADGAFDPAVDVVLSGLTATTGTGNNATVRIEIAYGGAGAYTAANTRVTIVAPGDGWTAGSTIVIPGTALGGATPANDLTITVNTVTAGTATIGPVETIFTGVVDEPESGYYQYILDTTYTTVGLTPLTIESAELGFRSLTAQVVKP